MLKFISLGSGSSGNCYYLSTDETSILVDAGIPIRSLMKNFADLNLNIEDISAVLITHDHADHIKSVGTLANDMHIPVYTTELVHQGMMKNYSVKHKILPESSKYVLKGVSFTVGNFTITPFDVIHDSTDCVGYRIETGGMIFCIVTDIGHVTPVIESEVSKANFLVVESNHDENKLMTGKYPAYLKGRIRGPKGHLSNNEAAVLIAEHGTPNLKHVWLCHLSEENNHPELAKKTMENVMRKYGIIPGVDFRLDVLKRKTRSDIYELTFFQ